jgi:hypothetical protein
MAEDAGNRVPVSKMTPEQKAVHQETVTAGKNWGAANPAPHHSNIVSHFEQATPDEIEYGKNWYKDAHHLAKTIGRGTNTPIHTVAGLFGNYSPQTPWGDNIMNAERVARSKEAIGGPGSGVFASTSQKNAAARMLAGEHHSAVLKGHKIRAFTNLVEHGGDKDPNSPDAVVDRHAVSVAHGTRVPADYYTYGLGNLTSPKLYGAYANLYHRAAQELSRRPEIAQQHGKLSAHQVQAITWLVRQRLNQALEEGASKKRSSKVASQGRRAMEDWTKHRIQYYPELGEKQGMVGYNFGS